MCLVLLILVALVVFLVLWSRSHHHDKERFGSEDQNYAITALEILQSDLHNGTVIDVGDRFLEHFEHEVVAVAKENDGKEHLTFAQPIDTRYWPYYYYSYPYRMQEGGSWPPGMHSRMRNWEPGYQTSGWSYWMRPGMTFDKWPRNRWVRNSGNYYFINNGKDRSEDFYRGT